MSEFASPSHFTVYFANERSVGLFTKQESIENYGGAEVQMYNLAKAFIQSGDIDIIILTKKTSPSVESHGIKIVQVMDSIRHGIPILSRWINKARENKIFSYHNGPAFLIASQMEDVRLMQIAQNKGVKTIYRINGDSLVDGSGLLPPEWISMVEERIKTADYVTSQNETQVLCLRDHFGIDSVIINSLSPDFDVLPFNNGDTILWIGRCDPVKRPWIFLELAKVLSQFQFKMVCPAADRALHREIIAEAMTIENLEFVFAASRTEIAALYNEASIVVSTSISEGVPGTLIEASIAKTPYISYELSFEKYLRENEIIICADGNMNVLAEQVCTLMGNEDLRRVIGTRAFDYAQRKWSKENVVPEYINLFKTMIGVDETRRDLGFKK
ncbi:MAG: glycosyltransferase family 4 protein [Coriobacteriia bacterium]|nr:glycosyltransferase family 4 protein [Coriobacteriia bacterium]